MPNFLDELKERGERVARGGNRIVSGAIPPPSPEVGDLWFDPDAGGPPTPGDYDEFYARLDGADFTGAVTHAGLVQRVDTRNQVLSYTGDQLTQVQERVGTTVIKTTTFAYDGSGRISTVTEAVADGPTITTTMGYTGDNLTSTTRAVT